MIGYEEMVLEFHEKFQHWIFTEHGSPSAAVRLLRLRLIAEELGELAEALNEKPLNVVLIADAAADLGYVLAGTSVTCGLGLDDIWTEPKVEERQTVVNLWARRRGIFHAVSELGNLACAIHQDEPQRLMEATIGLFRSAYAVSCVFDFPYHQIFSEVHKSNMSKELVSTPLDAGLKYGGKISKGPGYHPPEIKPILAAYKSMVSGPRGRGEAKR
jgi:hypothetical protein